MKKLFILPLALVISMGLRAQTSPVPPDKTYSIKLNLTQINTVLNALADKKLGESLDTYLSIRTQALIQMQDSVAAIKTDSIQSSTGTGVKKSPAKKPQP